MHDASTSLLQPGKTCWKAAVSPYASVLIDGEEYFAALRTALLQARRQILIAGWDFDTRTRLPRAPDESEPAPEFLGDLLGYLVRTRPELEIHVSRWDYHWFYSDDREADTRARLESVGVRFHDDRALPVTGCVHHKVVVIDGALAFCGGIDLTHKRWDTCAHRVGDEGRCDPSGAPYIPVHDTHMCVNGPAAALLGEYLQDNWPIGVEPPSFVRLDEMRWPSGLRPQFHDVRVGVARTLPSMTQRHAVREIENFYMEAIARAERTLYIENQYFTSTRIARALADRCRAQPQLQGLLVGMDKPKTPSELHTMGYGRSAFHQVLQEAQVDDRIPLLAAFTGDLGINVHSKLAIFDDRWLTVGSANLNRRSMGFDVECNLIVEASTAEHAAQIRCIRDRLLAEHLGREPEEIAAVTAQHGLLALLDSDRRDRSLERINPRSVEPNLGPLLAPIFDPEEPWSAPTSKRVIERAPKWGAAVVLLSALSAAAFDDRTQVSVEQALNSWSDSVRRFESARDSRDRSDKKEDARLQHRG